MHWTWSFQGFACSYKGPTAEHLVKARDFFERALAVDLRSVGALVGMASVDLTMITNLLADDRAALLSAVETTAITALSLAPDHAVAHSILGTVYILTNRAALGIAECEQALTLNRNLAAARSAIGLATYFMGQAAETEGHVLEALRLSPRDFSAYRWMNVVGLAKLQLGADAEAVDWFRRSIEANRNYSVAHFWLAAALGLLGALDEARISTKAGLALNPSFTIRRLRAVAKSSDNPIFLASLERLSKGMRLAEVPAG
jgi:tetratricopeptide (TPR) repeat protein